jgi:hypothetical protein
MQRESNARFAQMQADHNASMAQVVTMLQTQLDKAPAAAPAPAPNAGTTSSFNPLFSSILEKHPTLDEALLQEIFDKTFKPSNLLKLCSSSFFVPDSKRRKEEITLGEFTIPVGTDEYTSISQLIQALSLYFIIITAFAPEGVALPLARATHSYYHHLLDLFKRHTFRSVLLYHLSFHGKRIRTDVYDPVGWETPDLSFNNLLQTNERTAADPFLNDHEPAAKRQATGNKRPPCKKFNNGESTSKSCRYAHVCSHCLRGNHALPECL